MPILALPPEQIKGTRVELSNAIALLPTPSLLQLAGMLNLYAYCAARHYSAVHKIDGKLVVDAGEFENMLAVSKEGGLEMTATVLYIQDYLTKHWVGACNSCPSIRRMRRFMRDKLQLFDFEDGEKGKTTIPPTMKGIDYPRLLLAYEAVEHALYLRGRMPDGYEGGTKDELMQYSIPRDVMSLSEEGKLDEYFFPRHLGVNMVLLFNHCFEGVAVYRRRDDAIALKPNCLETVWNRQFKKPVAFSQWKGWGGVKKTKKYNSLTRTWERAFGTVEEFNRHAERMRKRGRCVVEGLG